MRVIFVISFILIANLSKANDIAFEFDHLYKDVQTISATFSQATEDDTIITGEFYLKKPNKIIWKYLTPHQITILIKDNTLTYYDHKLDEVSYRNVKNSVFSIILGTNSNLTSKLVSTSAGDIKKILLQDKFLDELFMLQLSFTNSPFTLKNLSLSSDNIELSNINLSNFKKNIPISDEIFTIPKKFLNIK